MGAVSARAAPAQLKLSLILDMGHHRNNSWESIADLEQEKQSIRKSIMGQILRVSNDSTYLDY